MHSSKKRNLACNKKNVILHTVQPSYLKLRSTLFSPGDRQRRRRRRERPHAVRDRVDGGGAAGRGVLRHRRRHRQHRHRRQAGPRGAAELQLPGREFVRVILLFFICFFFLLAFMIILKTILSYYLLYAVHCLFCYGFFRFFFSLAAVNDDSNDE